MQEKGKALDGSRTASSGAPTGTSLKGSLGAHVWQARNSDGKCSLAVLFLWTPRNCCVSWEQACPSIVLNKKRNDFLKSTQKSLKHKTIPGTDSTQQNLGTTDFFIVFFFYIPSLCSLSFPRIAQFYRWEGIPVIQGDNSGDVTWISKPPTHHPRVPGSPFLRPLHSVLPLAVVSKCWVEHSLINHNSQEDTDDGCNSQDICHWKETT